MSRSEKIQLFLQGLIQKPLPLDFILTADNYIKAAAAHPHCFYRMRVQNQTTSIELHIDAGEGKISDRIFKNMLAYRSEIERELGGVRLEWKDTADKEEKMEQVRRIIQRFSGGHDNPEAEWGAIYAEMSAAMEGFVAVFEPRLRRI